MSETTDAVENTDTPVAGTEPVVEAELAEQSFADWVKTEMARLHARIDALVK